MSGDAAGLRIAYVTPYDEAYRSIATHTARRIAAWEAGGAVVETFVIGGGGRAGRTAGANVLADLRGAAALIDRVRAFAPSVVYVRWLAPVPGLHRRLRTLAPVVVEIHADDLVEVARGESLRRLYLGLFRRRELHRADAATFVVSELAAAASFDPLPPVRGVFVNGSWQSPRDAAPAGGIRVGISAGGLNDWTGLDRFRDLAAALPDLGEWVVVCPDPDAAAIRGVVGDRVRVVGTESAEAYVAEVASWSAAFGPLALERKAMRTAAPLKVRDYLGLGVPTILPYRDEGAAGVDHELILKLAGPDDPPVERIDPDVLSAFVRRAHGRSLPAEISRLSSATEIERRRLAFLRDVAERG